VANVTTKNQVKEYAEEVDTKEAQNCDKPLLLYQSLVIITYQTFLKTILLVIIF